MELSKIKNITIVLMLTVDIILTFLIVRMLIVNSNREKAELEYLRQICAQREVELNIDALPSSNEMEAVSTARSEQMETDLATAIIGSCSVENQGGGIIKYVSQNGEGVFRSSGDFELTVNDEKSYKNIQTAVENIMKSAGAEVFNINGDDEDITVVCGYGNYGIFNCSILFEFEDNVLKTVKGKYPFEIKNASTEKILDCKTALVQFLNYINENDIQCQSIDDAAAGYIFTADVFGGGQIIPVWSITSGSERYYINAGTGQIENQGF